MRKLLKFLSPFAPDHSGAVSALFECGALTVICDAGGCTGNVCGFDEPRWFERRSAIFSAALRDMDAILGRDKALVEKIRDAAETLNPAFIAIVGTPVPAVIGTDMRALERMVRFAAGRPCIALATTGTGHYDLGVSSAQLALFRHFASGEEPAPVPGRAGLLGATPLDLSRCDAKAECEALRAMGMREVIPYGMGCGGELQAFRQAGGVARNYVVSPSGLAAARYLQERFGTAYEPFFPSLPQFDIDGVRGRRILVVHQQIAANAMREALERAGAARVSVASWFQLDRQFMRGGDCRVDGEEHFAALVADGGFELIAADQILRHALPGYHGGWLDFPHFAVSGTLCGGAAGAHPSPSSAIAAP